ncbi:hypothetical protein QOZ80_4BG0345040 [Eleusine coracana subsp. coracana]|nr:hypothetical protein QOZ80_4BG0345040 [Eleusine coracana subsp. coracana]
MAPPPRTWADLPTDILTSVVVDRIATLQSYLTVRGVCAAWRSALPPEPPCLVVSGSGVLHPTSAAFSYPFRLLTLPDDSRCVGACHGWVAIVYTKPRCFYFHRVPRGDTITMEVEEEKSYWYRNFHGERIEMDPTKAKGFRQGGKPKPFLALFNPVTGRRIELPEHDALDPWKVDRVVFAPNPRRDDFTVVAAFGFNSLAYVSTRDHHAAAAASWSFSIREIQCDTAMADMVYHEEDGGDRVYCLARGGSDVHVLHVPRGRPSTNPAVTPLHYPGSAVFPPPHDRLSGILEGAKSLVFCGGEMYQVWRNTMGGAFRVQLPEPDHWWWRSFLSVREDEVFVLKFDPSRRPCWRVVGDLGGHAVFVGPGNSAVAVRAEEVPGVRGDCVYWIGMGRIGNRTASVFDMRTGKSAPCVPPGDGVGVPVCWYWPGGDAGSSSRKDGQSLQALIKEQWVREKMAQLS